MGVTSPTSVDTDTLRENIRADLARRKRRRLLLVAAGVVVLFVVAIAGVISARPPKVTEVTADHRPHAADATNLGISEGTGPVIIDEYFDFLCPSCRKTDQVLAPRLKELVQAHRITVIYHPIAKLDSYSTPAGYSTRAALAAGCAADAGRFTEYRSLLLKEQPAEGGPGLSDTQLLTLAKSLGINTTTMRDCVTSGRYRDWVKAATQHAEVTVGVVATPTILVNGKAISSVDTKVIQSLNAALT